MERHGYIRRDNKNGRRDRPDLYRGRRMSRPGYYNSRDEPVSHTTNTSTTTTTPIYPINEAPLPESTYPINEEFHYRRQLDDFGPRYPDTYYEYPDPPHYYPPPAPNTFKNTDPIRKLNNESPQHYDNRYNEPHFVYYDDPNYVAGEPTAVDPYYRSAPGPPIPDDPYEHYRESYYKEEDPYYLSTQYGPPPPSSHDRHPYYVAPHYGRLYKDDPYYDRMSPSEDRSADYWKDRPKFKRFEHGKPRHFYKRPPDGKFHESDDGLYREKFIAFTDERIQSDSLTDLSLKSYNDDKINADDRQKLQGTNFSTTPDASNFIHTPQNHTFTNSKSFNKAADLRFESIQDVIQKSSIDTSQTAQTGSSPHSHISDKAFHSLNRSLQEIRNTPSSAMGDFKSKSKRSVEATSMNIPSESISIDAGPVFHSVKQDLTRPNHIQANTQTYSVNNSQHITDPQMQLNSQAASIEPSRPPSRSSNHSAAPKSAIFSIEMLAEMLQDEKEKEMKLLSKLEHEKEQKELQSHERKHYDADKKHLSKLETSSPLEDSTHTDMNIDNIERRSQEQIFVMDTIDDNPNRSFKMETTPKKHRKRKSYDEDFEVSRDKFTSILEKSNVDVSSQSEKYSESFKSSKSSQLEVEIQNDAGEEILGSPMIVDIDDDSDRLEVIQELVDIEKEEIDTTAKLKKKRRRKGWMKKLFSEGSDQNLDILNTKEVVHTKIKADSISSKRLKEKIDNGKDVSVDSQAVEPVAIVKSNEFPDHQSMDLVSSIILHHKRKDIVKSFYQVLRQEMTSKFALRPDCPMSFISDDADTSVDKISRIQKHMPYPKGSHPENLVDKFDKDIIYTSKSLEKVRQYLLNYNQKEISFNSYFLTEYFRLENDRQEKLPKFDATENPENILTDQDATSDTLRASSEIPNRMISDESSNDAANNTLLYRGNAVNSEEEYQRILKELADSEKIDPQKRWKSTEAGVPPMTLRPIHWVDENFKDDKALERFITASQLQYRAISQAYMNEIYRKNHSSDISTFHDTMVPGSNSLLFPTTGLRPFTKEEQNIYMEKYLLHPKRFDIIWKALPGRTYGEIVQYYYENKKRHMWKKWLRMSNSASMIALDMRRTKNLIVDSHRPKEESKEENPVRKESTGGKRGRPVWKHLVSEGRADPKSGSNVSKQFATSPIPKSSLVAPSKLVPSDLSKSIPMENQLIAEESGTIEPLASEQKEPNFYEVLKQGIEPIILKGYTRDLFNLKRHENRPLLRWISTFEDKKLILLAYWSPIERHLLVNWFIEYGKQWEKICEKLKQTRDILKQSPISINSKFEIRDKDDGSMKSEGEQEFERERSSDSARKDYDAKGNECTDEINQSLLTNNETGKSVGNKTSFSRTLNPLSKGYLRIPKGNVGKSKLKNDYTVTIMSKMFQLILNPDSKFITDRDQDHDINMRKSSLGRDTENETNELETSLTHETLNGEEFSNKREKDPKKRDKKNRKVVWMNTVDEVKLFYDLYKNIYRLNELMPNSNVVNSEKQILSIPPVPNLSRKSKAERRKKTDPNQNQADDSKLVHPNRTTVPPSVVRPKVVLPSMLHQGAQYLAFPTPLSHPIILSHSTSTIANIIGNSTQTTINNGSVACNSNAVPTLTARSPSVACETLQIPNASSTVLPPIIASPPTVDALHGIGTNTSPTLASIAPGHISPAPAALVEKMHDLLSMKFGPAKSAPSHYLSANPIFSSRTLSTTGPLLPSAQSPNMSSFNSVNTIPHIYGVFPGRSMSTTISPTSTSGYLPIAPKPPAVTNLSATQEIRRDSEPGKLLLRPFESLSSKKLILPKETGPMKRYSEAGTFSISNSLKSPLTQRQHTSTQSTESLFSSDYKIDIDTSSADLKSELPEET